MKDHNPSYLANLHNHIMWSAADTVLLGNAALEQLSMTSSNAERPHESLLYWLQNAITPMGRRSLRERCLKPIAMIDELNARQERIAALRDDTKRQPIENYMRGMSDLSRLYRRFQLKHGTTDDLIKVIMTYEKASRLLDITASKPYGVQTQQAIYVAHIQSLLSRWDIERIRANRTINSDNIAVGSFHPWRRGIHPPLDACEDEWTTLECSMTALRQQWESDLEEKDVITWTLNDDAPFTFQTTERRAKGIETTSKSRRKQIVTHVKRGASTKVTLICDTLDDANKRGLDLRRRWKTLVAEYWAADWTQWMTDAIDDDMLDAMVDWLGRLDAECTLASISNAYGYVRPTYIESTDTTPAGFQIKDLRHPIIERLNNGTAYIPHTLAYGLLAATSNTEDDVAKTPAGILLYGVNAAGKSSLGKALGLAIVMAQCGMPVPATSMTIIPYTKLFTRILGNDNLWAGMSSFVVEMTEFRSILRSADNRTLVIGDELCAGTETASATAIVAAGINTLAKRNAHFFFATHLHELAEINMIKANAAIQFYHLTVRPNAQTHTLIYDRKIKQGCGSPMYGLEVCRGLDMDEEFLDLAFNIRKQLFTDAGARLSTYNARVIVQACEVCGQRTTLETHHIVPQAAADHDGHIAPGVHKNATHNLVALCDDCHKKHHNKMLDIQGWVQTSKGRQLEVNQ
jgi:DNA mismatch repair protein MutS